MNGTPKHVEGGWCIFVGEGIITQIVIDHSLGLNVLVDIDSSFVIVLENVFTLITANGSELIDWDCPAELGRFAELHGAVVTNLDVAESGVMTVSFADGRRIVARPHHAFESYEIRSRATVEDGGWLVIAKPGGGIAISHR